MPATASMIINDGIAPITFTPESVSNTHVLMQNLGQGVLALRDLIHFDRPASGKDVRRSFRVNTPYEVTLADGTKVVKQVTMKIEEISPSDVPVAVRTRCRLLGANGILHADTAKVFDNPEWMW